VAGLLGFFTNKWVVQGFGLLVLALLVWFAGPLVAIADWVPLDSAWVRGLAIVALVLLWGAYHLVLRMLAGRKDSQLGGELAASARSAEEEASAEEVETLRQGFEDALKLLRESRALGKDGKHCLYELPWYIIIGAPGSGKTTALVNCGLKFPLAERLGKQAVKGVGGTRNCDWWFTDEAVLLDTAGRWTTQDSHQAVDAAAWQGFLGLLKKYRPRRPLNGVLLSLSLSDLLQQTEEERVRHAAAMRKRLQELHVLLGVRLPVYLLLTKTDLVAGFSDFFADFGQEEREQVWGETFPRDDPAHPVDGLGQFGAAYDELLQRLNQRTFHRLQAERDIQRRSLILDFPQQMALLKPALLAFLDGVFAPNRYEQPPLLRGVYFTSGTQEGTPIDRVMGVLAGAFRLDRQAMPMYSGRGKSFFLTRLVKDVIFPEAELAGVDPRIERRQKLIHYGSLGAALLATLGIIVLWAFSYSANKAAIAQTEEQITRFRAARVAPADARSNFKMLLPKLDALLAVRDIWRQAGWPAHFGLYQGEKLEAGADEAYEQLLRGYFLPSIVSRLQERLQGKPDILLLKAYLMFGEPEKMDPKFAEAVARADWEQMFNAEPEAMAGLAVHLRNLLGLKLQATRLDEGLVAGVRAALTQAAPEQQCYEGFKAEYGADRSHDFKLAEALRPNGQKAFVIDGGKDGGVVPGLFTAWGYGEWFLKKSLVFVKGCMEQNWVLDIPASSSDPREIDRLHEKFKLLYLREYQQYWSDILAGVKLRSAQNINQTVDLLDILSRPESPLRLLLMAVEKNTSLGKVSAAAAELLGQAAAKANLAPDEQTRKLIDAAKQTAGADTGSGGDPVRWLENYYENLNALVRGEPGKPVPLDAALGKAKELRDYFMQTGGAAQAQAGAGGDVLGLARMEFSRLPEPVKSWLMSLTNAGDTLIRSEAKGELKAKLNAQLQAAGIAGAGGGGGKAGGGKAGGGAGGGGGPSLCKAAFNGRYPFVRGSPQDAPLADFNRFFAPNGVIDRYFQANLKDLVDTGAAQWRQKSAGGQAPGLSPAAIREFQRAAKIRDAFFSAGGSSPQVQFDLKPLELDARADTVRLTIEGQDIAFPQGAGQAVRIQWPGPAAGSGARIVFEQPDKSQASRAKEGPWALFRLFDEAAPQRSAAQDRFTVTFQVEGFAARFELRALSVNNPFSLGDARNFHCPESL